MKASRSPQQECQIPVLPRVRENPNTGQLNTLSRRVFSTTIAGSDYSDFGDHADRWDGHQGGWRGQDASRMTDATSRRGVLCER
jgi:hypothetical protein